MSKESLSWCPLGEPTTKMEGDKKRLDRPVQSYEMLDMMTTDRQDSHIMKFDCLKAALRANLLVVFTTIGVAIGFATGFAVRSTKPSGDLLMWLGLPGEMYMRMLQMMILPLIICSVITGTASMDPKCNGRVSVVALSYIVLTNTFPCLLAIALSQLIKPGEGVNTEVGGQARETDPNSIMDKQDIFADLIRNLMPDNLITACFQQATTKYDVKEEVVLRNVSGILENVTTVTRSRVNTSSSLSPNTLGIVLCCMLFGIAVSVIGEKAKPFFLFFEAATTIILKILNWLLWYTPIGVLSLIAVAIARADNIVGTFQSLGLFAATVVASLATYQLILLPLVIFAVTRRNPYKIQLMWCRACMVAIAAAASAVAIPEGLRALDRLKVDKRIAHFVIPLGTALNRDGSAIFIAAACMFIGQLSGVEMAVSQILIIWVLTAALSLAIPSIPSASVVCVVIILTTLGIPVEQIGLLFALEWFLDRLRAGVNQISIGYCAVVSYHFCQSVLHQETEEDLVV